MREVREVQEMQEMQEVREVRDKSVISHHHRKNGIDDRRPLFEDNAYETLVLILTECIAEEWEEADIEK